MFINNTPSTSYSQFLQRDKHFHQFTERVDSFLDRDFFRRSISLHYQNLYVSTKRRNWIYRLLFFGFGFLFFTFAILIFLKTTNAAFNLYFNNNTAIKDCIDIFCVLLSLGAFTFGYMMHPEKEAVNHLVSKVVRELRSPTKHLEVEFNAIFKHFSQKKTFDLT